ncbi:MAG: hypothetical protein CL932_10860 [Deltaproteobacteria bacterium]|nr:hypothetical protein [Deltaproteobacteria bacterium]MBK05268.1 hypothetical protein [Deltaproteobacteria bacterium]|tara:strand:- start:7479 stop:8696 length:1218 start_codon:yes stop_codon:yes gene_type:complete
MSSYVFIFIILTLVYSLSVFYKTQDLFHPMVIFPVAYVYFTMGPVVTYVMGGNIYSGIVKDKIDDASTAFVLALLGMCFAIIPLFRGSQKVWDVKLSLRQKKQAFWYITLFATFVNLVSMFFVLTNFSIVMSGVKGALLRAIPRYSLWHFNYLLFWTFCISLLLAFNYWQRSKLIIFNAFIYVVYCVLLNERDFLLVLLAIVAYRTTSQRMNRAYSILLAVGISLIFVGLFWFRSNASQVDFLELYLGQGNNLNVITNVMHWSDEWLEPKYGWTYIQSMLNLMPSFIYRQGVPLVDWFKNEFAPGSDSGYGFSLEGEAFMNFGFPGIFIFFFCFGKLLLYFYNAKNKGSLFGFYMYYFCLIFAVYTLRGDSLMLFKGFSYATGFFYFILALSTNGRIRFRKIMPT